MTRRFEAVTFDFWQTLMVARPADVRDRRAGLWKRAFDDHGIPVSSERMDECFDRLLERFNSRWEANQQFTSADAAAWAIDEIGVEVSAELRSILEATFSWSGDDVLPELAPGVGAVLEALKAEGFRVGIICDVGMTPSGTLIRYLEAHGLREHFDHWSFSDQVGVYKPDRKIFEHALAGLGVVDPSRAVHTGDLRRTDVAGALGIGMGTVRFAGIHDDAPTGADDHPEADHVTMEHVELLGVVTGG